MNDTRNTLSDEDRLNLEFALQNQDPILDLLNEGVTIEDLRRGGAPEAVLKDYTP